MNKRGQAGVEQQLWAVIEIVLAVLLVGTLTFMATNPDSFSNINKFYAEEDLSLMTETLLAAPGTIEYNYEIKTMYSVNIKDDAITVTRKDVNIIASYDTYHLIFKKNQGSSQLGVQKSE